MHLFLLEKIDSLYDPLALLTVISSNSASNIRWIVKAIIEEYSTSEGLFNC